MSLFGKGTEGKRGYRGLGACSWFNYALKIGRGEKKIVNLVERLLMHKEPFSKFTSRLGCDFY